MKKTITFFLFIFLMLSVNTVFADYFLAPKNAVKELTAKRTYNTKAWELPNGQTKYHCHTAHKHYKKNGKFEEIDTTLVFDNTKKKWKQSKASYHCEIPEYSDSEFIFYNAYKGANHYIKATPQAEHIKGVLQSDNSVLYKNAFGKGIDLQVFPEWSGLKKVIIVNEKPEVIKDMSFDFELLLPSVVDVKDKADVKWDKTSKLDFKGKTLKIGKDKCSYFRNALMWDSSDKDNTQKVEIELYTKNSKTYLKKTIPKEYLENAVYPVYTDHPTSYFAGSGDGWIQKAAAGQTSVANVWAILQDTATGDAAYDWSAGGNYTQGVGGWLDWSTATQRWSGQLGRSFFPIDTSGIDNGATISAASLFVYWEDLLCQDDDAEAYFAVVETSQASTSSLGTGDYDECGDAVDNPTLGSAEYDMTADLSSNQYNELELNATGIGWIDDEGTTKLGVREGHDIEDVDWYATNDMYQFAEVRFSEYSGTDSDPYLEVTTGGGGSPTIKRPMIFF